jgi:hypothetical protein
MWSHVSWWQWIALLVPLVMTAQELFAIADNTVCAIRHGSRITSEYRALRGSSESADLTVKRDARRRSWRR